MKINTKIIFLLALTLSVSAFSDTPRNFSSAKKKARIIFNDNRETLYCGCKYSKKLKVDLKSCGMQQASKKKRARRVEWEHIMPAENFGHHFKCWREKICYKKNGKKYKGRKCCEKIDKNFRKAESELYNLWPAVGLVNAARSNYRYSEINSSKKFYGCDFKVQNRKVEPADKVKGLVARANLFMSEKYNIKLSKSQKKLFDNWNKKFPPSNRELNWAKRVEKVEGYSNPYIKGAKAEMIGGSQVLPPKYLSVPGFKKCLSEKSMGTWTSICLPSKMPVSCAADSWKQLNTMDLPSC